MSTGITHIELTTKDYFKENYLTTEDWDEYCNVPLQTYEEFLTKVPDYKIDCSIAIFQSEGDYKQWQTTENTAAYQKVWTGSLKQLKPAIERFIREHKLDKLDRLEDTHRNNDLLWYSLSFGRETTVPGFYYHERGFQNGGMPERFCQIFQQYELWGKQEDVELLYACYLEGLQQRELDRNTFQNYKQWFRWDFVDTFCFGSSLLRVM